MDGRTLRVFEEKPSVVSKKVNLHEELPEDLFEKKDAKAAALLDAMDIRGMWTKLEREHPEDMQNCQIFQYSESVMAKTARGRKLFPSDSEMALEASKPLPKITAFVKTPKISDRKEQISAL